MKNYKPFERVFVTKDYDQFREIKGNRKLNELHLRRLFNSIEEHGYLFVPILVNEKMEVIDGQHRLSCMKALGLAVYYVIAKGYGLNEVRVLNENTKNWNADDFMNTYCDMGKKEYFTYRAFRETYGLQHNICMGLLSGSSTGKKVQELFKAGEFKVKEYAEACEVAESLLLIKPYYQGWGRWTFVLAFVGVMKRDKFIFAEFISKLKLQPSKLVDCVNVDQYRDLIEDIYNYKRREKVNLRY